MKNRDDQNKKYVRKIFLPHQYEDEAEFLTKMSNDGWQFVMLHRPSKYEFKRDNSYALRYQLDFVTKEEDTEDYHQLYKDAGWQETYEWPGINNGKWYYFCKNYDEAYNEEIFTDKESKYEMLQKLWKHWIGFCLLIIIIELNGARIFIDAIIDDYLNPWTIIFFGAFIILILFIIVEYICMIYGLYRKKTKLRKEIEERL